MDDKGDNIDEKKRKKKRKCRRRLSRLSLNGPFPSVQLSRLVSTQSTMVCCCLNVAISDRFVSPRVYAKNFIIPHSNQSLHMTKVEGGKRGVIFDRVRGVLPDVVPEGTHFLLPWIQKPVIFDIRTRPRNISTTTGSKDMQTVSLTLRVLSRPDVAKLPLIYSNLGLDFDDRVLPSIGNEVSPRPQTYCCWCMEQQNLTQSMDG